MSRPLEKLTVLNRGKKGVRQNAPKSHSGFKIASESAAKHCVPSTGSENLKMELPITCDGNHIETLVGEEKAKRSYTSISQSNANCILKTSEGEVDFGGGNCGEFLNRLPRIVDLCVEDKKRILQLINELANCKEEKEIMIKEVNNLKETLKQQQNEMKLTSERFVAQKDTLALKVENLVTSRDNLSSDIENLQSCIAIQKNEIEKQASCIANLKVEKRHLQKQLLEHENQIKIATSNIESLTERLSFYEPQIKMKWKQGSPSEQNTIGNQMISIPGEPRAEKSQLAQCNDDKVEGRSGDPGTHILQEPMSCSANTDVGFFAVRMCPHLGSGAALVVCRPPEHKFA